MKRRGFTLIEMMIAFVIFTVVVTQLIVVTRGMFQLWQNKMWEIDFGLKMRLVRERLLFQAVPYTGGDLYAGFTSATNIYKVGNQMRAYFQYGSAGETSAGWSATPQNAFPQFQIAGLDDGEKSIDDTVVSNALFFVSVATTLKTFDGKTESNRVERVAIPTWEHLGEVADKLPWEYFMEVREGDILWKY